MDISLHRCNFCIQNCGVDRASGEVGICSAGKHVCVYSYDLHYGEEPPVSGEKGSGTIFFANCSMRCVYCQNYKFSQLPVKGSNTIEELSDMMIALQQRGAHNINLVSPTHYALQILEALYLAKEKGLDLPIVYNTGGYDSPETIDAFADIVDIFLVDMKYSDDKYAEKFSHAPNYVQNNRYIVKKMYEHAGELILDDKGIAKKGVIVRCLVLPNNISGTQNTLQWIKDEISDKVHISLMSQYYPVFNAFRYKELNRRVNFEEYESVKNKLFELGFFNGWVQDSPDKMDDSLGGHRIQKFDSK